MRKKIYSLIAMMLLAGSAMAQTLSATVDGKAVKDGETIECVYDKIEYPGPIPVIPTTWKMEPHVVVKSNAVQEVSVCIEVLDKKGDDQIQNCFTNCITANAANNYTVKETAKMAAGEERDAQIHFSTKINPNENPLERSVKVTLEAGGETLIFTLHMVWDPNGALSVMGVDADKNKVRTYALHGVRVNESTLPKGKIYIKGKKKYMKK